MGLRLRMTDGKEIVEVRPVANIHKGTAVVAPGRAPARLRRDASVVFVGDDRTDEDAFRSLRARFPRAVTIRVDESGEDTTAAEIRLRDPAAVHEFLEWLAARRA